MTARFDRPRAPQRRASVADWIAALEAAERLADEAEGRTGAGGDLVQFRLRVRDLAAEAFPSGSPLAQLAAAAFLNAARLFAHADAAPETRTACAPLLRAAARYLDDVLTRFRTAQADAWKRQFGDDV